MPAVPEELEEELEEELLGDNGTAFDPIDPNEKIGEEPPVVLAVVVVPAVVVSAVVVSAVVVSAVVVSVVACALPSMVRANVDVGGVIELVNVFFTFDAGGG